MTDKQILPNLDLKRGAHDSPADGACIMEVLSLALGAYVLNEYGKWEVNPTGGPDFNDLPPCTYRPIALVAQSTWDATMSGDEGDTARLRLLAKFLPRLLRAKHVANDRVAIRIALAAARYVEDDNGIARIVNDATEAWLAGDLSDSELRRIILRCTGNAAEDIRVRAAVHAATRRVGLSIDTATDVVIAKWTDDDAQLLYEGFLDALLTAHEKACAEEGVLAFDPEWWEADAIEFVDTLMAELAEEIGVVIYLEFLPSFYVGMAVVAFISVVIKEAFRTSFMDMLTTAIVTAVLWPVVLFIAYCWDFAEWRRDK